MIASPEEDFDFVETVGEPAELVAVLHMYDLSDTARPSPLSIDERL